MITKLLLHQEHNVKKKYMCFRSKRVTAPSNQLQIWINVNFWCGNSAPKFTPSLHLLTDPDLMQVIYPPLLVTWASRNSITTNPSLPLIGWGWTEGRLGKSFTTYNKRPQEELGRRGDKWVCGGWQSRNRDSLLLDLVESWIHNPSESSFISALMFYKNFNVLIICHFE